MKSVNFNQLANQLKMPSKLLTKILVQYNILIEGEFNNLLPTDFALENAYCYTILIDEHDEVMFSSSGVEFIDNLLSTQYCVLI